MEAPTAPDVEDKLVIVGVGRTVKFTPLLATPPGAVTMTFPEVAPEGTVAVMLDEAQLAIVAVVPLNVTFPLPCGAPKFVPEIVTEAPRAAAFGDKPVILGAGVTVKVTPALAWPPTVTTTAPVVAPLGTGAVILVLPQIVGVEAVPLNLTVLLT
jgi:hypothetical protein